MQHYFTIIEKERIFILKLNGHSLAFSYRNYTLKKAKQIFINSIP